MRTAIIAASLLLALAAPLAANAEPATSCGVPQGYGTSNPHTFNRSTCGFGDSSYSSVATPSSSYGVGGGQPQGFGTSNPYIPNSGSPHLGSATAS